MQTAVIAKPFCGSRLATKANASRRVRAANVVRAAADKQQVRLQNLCRRNRGCVTQCWVTIELEWVHEPEAFGYGDEFTTKPDWFCIMDITDG